MDKTQRDAGSMADLARATRAATVEGWCRLHDWGRAAWVDGDTVHGLLDIRSDGSVAETAVSVRDIRAWAGY